MSLTFQCDFCSKTHRAEAHWAGRRVKCKACGEVMVIPAAPGHAAPVRINTMQEIPVNAYVTLPGEEQIDAIIYFLAFVGFAAAALAMCWRYLLQHKDQAVFENPAREFCFAAGYMLGTLIVPTLLAYIMRMGIWSAGKILGFASPPDVQRRCLAVIGLFFTPAIFMSVLNLHGTAETLATLVSVLGGIAAFALLIRLRILPLLLTGAFALGPSLLLPIGLVVWIQLRVQVAMPIMPVSTHQSTATAKDERKRPMLTADWSNVPQPSSLAPSVTDQNLPENAGDQPLHPLTPTITTSPAERLLQKIAEADQTYAQANGGQYADSPQTLVKAGFLSPENAKPGDGESLIVSNGMPTMNPIPDQVIVLYIMEPDHQTYIALFGDWHVRTISASEWRKTRSRSSAARRNATPFPR